MIRANPSPETIARTRQRAGMTQGQAASIVHVSWRTWQAWELGQNAMPPGLFELFLIKTGQASNTD